jgi:hypothetical protein
VGHGGNLRGMAPEVISERKRPFRERRGCPWASQLVPSVAPDRVSVSLGPRRR